MGQVGLTTSKATMGEFYLSARTPGSLQVSISEKHWQKLNSAREFVTSIRQCEALFSVFAESVSEIEKLMLTSLVDYSLSETDDLTGLFQSIRTRANLRLLTLLTASRCYVDQVPQILGRLPNDSPSHRDFFKESLSNAFDESFEYRTMDSLRNHGQHAMLPLGGFSLSSSNQSPGDEDFANYQEPSRQRITFQPYIKKEVLINNKELRAATRKELEFLEQPYLDLKHFVRTYSADIAKCHYKLLVRLTSLFDEATVLLQDACGGWRQTSEAESQYVHLFRTDTTEDKISQFIDGHFYHSSFSTKRMASSMSAFQARYFSSEINTRTNTYAGGSTKYWKPK